MMQFGSFQMKNSLMIWKLWIIQWTINCLYSICVIQRMISQCKGPLMKKNHISLIISFTNIINKSNTLWFKRYGVYIFVFILKTNACQFTSKDYVRILVRNKIGSCNRYFCAGIRTANREGNRCSFYHFSWKKWWKTKKLLCEFVSLTELTLWNRNCILINRNVVFFLEKFQWAFKSWCSLGSRWDCWWICWWSSNGHCICFSRWYWPHYAVSDFEMTIYFDKWRVWCLEMWRNFSYIYR